MSEAYVKERMSKEKIVKENEELHQVNINLNNNKTQNDLTSTINSAPKFANDYEGSED